MANAVVYEGNIQSSMPDTVSLFTGQKLWFSQSVPQRQWLIQNAELNGARVVPLDKQADIRLVDHARKNQAPGTHSYRYVELSIRNGKLEDLDAHQVGTASRVDRPVGSVVTASKGGRNKFTDEDDQLLWNSIKPYMDAGGYWKGNEIYKELERYNPSHTFQSWRDRWVKYTQFQNRQVTTHPVLGQSEIDGRAESNPRSPKRRRLESSQQVKRGAQANVGVTQTRQPRPIQSTAQEGTAGSSRSLLTNDQLDRDARVNAQTQNQTNSPPSPKEPDVRTEAGGRDRDTEVGTTSEKPVKSKPQPEDSDDDETADGNSFPLAFNFTQHEARMLYGTVWHIWVTKPEKLDESWTGVAKEYPNHTKDAWRKFFYQFIVPEYKKRHDLETDEELDRHCAAKVRAQRRKAAEAASQAGNPVDATIKDATHGNNQSGDLAPAHSGDPGPRCALCQAIEPRDRICHRRGRDICVDCLENFTSHGTTRSSTEPQAQASNSSQSLQEDPASQRPSRNVDASTSLVSRQDEIPLMEPINPSQHRPPQPNESRKLSQGRGSQSTQTQSQSNSSSRPSQPSQQNQILLEQPRPLAEADGPSQYAIQGKHVVSDDSEQQSPASMPEILQVLPNTGHSKVLVSTNLQPGQPSEESEHDTGRFVTQMSGRREESSSEDSQDLADIPFRAPSPPQAGARLQPALRVASGDGPSLRHSSKTDRSSEPRSSQPIVDFVEADANGTENESASADFQSETTSEAIQFEADVELTHAWDTAPEQGTRIPLGSDEVDVTSNAELPGIPDRVMAPRETEAHLEKRDFVPQTVVQISSSASEASSKSSIPDSIDDSIRTDEVETAPTHARDKSLHLRPTDQKLDTQALFEQPMPLDFADFTAIPEPPGGWDDGEDEENDDDDEITVTIAGRSAATPVPQNRVLPADRTNRSIPQPQLQLASPVSASELTSATATRDTTNRAPINTKVVADQHMNADAGSDADADADADADTDIDMDTWLAQQTHLHPSTPSHLLEPLIHRAAHATSMNLTLATAVVNRMLTRLAKGKFPPPSALDAMTMPPSRRRDEILTRLADECVPIDVRGCWTTDDDAALLGVNGRDVRRVEDKHGERGVRMRFEFLEVWHTP